MSVSASSDQSNWRSGVGVHLLFLLCLVTFPLALLVPGGSETTIRYAIELPVVLWGAAISFAGFSNLRRRSPVIAGGGVQSARVAPLLPLAVMILVFLLLVAWRVAECSFASIVLFTSLFLIPVYLMVCPDERIPRKLGIWMALLWLISALHGLQQLKVGSHFLGIAKDSGHAVALLACTAPWAWQAARRNHTGKTRNIFLTVLIGGLTLMLAWYAAAWSVFLVGGVYGFIGLLSVKQWRRWRFLAAAFIILAVLGAVLVKRDAIAAALAADVRPPMWLSTLDMIGDSPLAGVGPGNFQNRFPAYRSPLHMRSTNATLISPHPHNQVLYVAAVGGLPLALLWGAMSMCIFRFRAKNFQQRAVHFAAFILVGCSFLDSTLYVAPTALLGLIVLGLHLRQTVPVRMVGKPAACPLPQSHARVLRSPAASAPASGQFCFPCPVIRYGLVILVAFVACFYTVRKIRADWYRLQADQAMAAREYDHAYDSFLQAHESLPADIQPLYEATKLAIFALNNPRLALGHGEKIMKKAPDIAHINWLLGKAYERSGNGRRALLYYRREAELFPYNIKIQNFVLNRLLREENLDMAFVVRSRLAKARWWQLTNRVGTEPATALADGFRSALLKRDFGTAVKRANEVLARMPQQAVCEPAGRSLAEQGHPKFMLEGGGFSGQECPYWLQAFTCPKALFPDLATGEAGLAEAARRGLALQKQIPEGLDPLNFAEEFRLAGWMAAAVVTSPDAGPEIVELRWNDWTALVILPDRVVPGASARSLFDAAFVKDNKLAGEVPDRITLMVPVRAADFWTRNQILGDVLRQGKATGTPVLGESPTLYMALYRALGGTHEDVGGKIDWQPAYR